MESLIKLSNLQKYYKVGKDKLHVLKSINLDIKKGEFIMIMGKSGSGKTTLLNILGILDRFDEGSYEFSQENINKLNENQRSQFRNKHIGFIFQQFNLIETLDIYKNVELPLIYDNKLNKKEKKGGRKYHSHFYGSEYRMYSYSFHAYAFTLEIRQI